MAAHRSARCKRRGSSLEVLDNPPTQQIVYGFQDSALEISGLIATNDSGNYLGPLQDIADDRGGCLRSPIVLAAQRIVDGCCEGLRGFSGQTVTEQWCLLEVLLTSATQQQADDCCQGQFYALIDTCLLHHIAPLCSASLCSRKMSNRLAPLRRHAVRARCSS